MTNKRPPDRNQAPVVQRVRIRYAKRGRLRFTSHRDFARALERAVRRAQVPIAYSAGFSPHPKISYASATPTGMASEAEYLEIGLASEVDPQALAASLDAALPDGLDVLEAVVATTPSFTDRLVASHWIIELPGMEQAEVRAAVDAFLAAGEILVERLTKSGRRTFDVRSAVVSLVTVGESSTGTPAGAGDGTPVTSVDAPAGTRDDTPGAPSVAGSGQCAILDIVVQHVTPSVRPDDVLAGLHVIAGLEPRVSPRTIRLAQGMLTGQGAIGDPLAADRAGTLTRTPSA